jgi:protein TonB
VPIETPAPDVPDSLRDEADDRQSVVMIDIGADGAPIAVKIVVTSGNASLDRLAITTAKRWRFKPATSGGIAVESRMRLTIEFQIQ